MAVALWGASFVVTRVALRSWSPMGLVAARMLLAAVLLYGVLWLRFGSLGGLLPEPRDRVACLLLGLVLAAHMLIQAHGLEYTTAIHTGWIVGFMPVMIALAAHGLRRQRLAARGWVGVVVATGGVMLIVGVEPAEFVHARFGDLLQLSSCVTWTVYTISGAGPVARNGAMRVTALAMLGAVPLLAVGAGLRGTLQASLSGEALAAAVFLGLACSGLAMVLWYRALNHLGPTRAGSMLYIEPLFTLAVAIPALHEPVTVETLIGGGGVLAGVWLVSAGVRRDKQERRF